jgi:hypothetical protein
MELNNDVTSTTPLQQQLFTILALGQQKTALIAALCSVAAA